MKIREINLVQFRNYERLTLRPKDGINLFFGKNGSGKTNLLEAIHYCALGKSHRINNDQNAVMNGYREASCALDIQGRMSGFHIRLKLQPEETVKKSVWIDQKKVRKFSEMMGCFQCVIFSPEDLGLIREGPAVRRRFLDMMISQVNRKYFIALQQYRAAMEQRNAILRLCRQTGRKPDPAVEDFEAIMISSAMTVTEERNRYTGMLMEKAAETYSAISGQDREIFSMLYHSFLKDRDDPESEYQKQLRESREDDIRQGITTCGPHRDDLVFMLNRRNMKLYSSQGQIRTAALGIKLSQLNILQEISGDSPVLLLDDVMSELDKGRRMRLLEKIGNTQTFITCSDESDLDEFSESRVYDVYSEDGKGYIRETGMKQETETEQITDPDFT